MRLIIAGQEATKGGLRQPVGLEEMLEECAGLAAGDASTMSTQGVAADLGETLRLIAMCRAATRGLGPINDGLAGPAKGTECGGVVIVEPTGQPAVWNGLQHRRGL